MSITQKKGYYQQLLLLILILIQLSNERKQLICVFYHFLTIVYITIRIGNYLWMYTHKIQQYIHPVLYLLMYKSWHPIINDYYIPDKICCRCDLEIFKATFYLFSEQVQFAALNQNISKNTLYVSYSFILLN